MNTELLTLVVTRFDATKYPTFADRLKLAMILRDYSIRKLGKCLYLSPTTVSGYLSGRRMPDCIILCKIAKELRVSTDFLLGIVDYIVE